MVSQYTVTTSVLVPPIATLELNGGYRWTTIDGVDLSGFQAGLLVGGFSS